MFLHEENTQRLVEGSIQEGWRAEIKKKLRDYYKQQGGKTLIGLVDKSVWVQRGEGESGHVHIKL